MRNDTMKSAGWGLLLLVLVSGGCHGLGDPACALRDELADQHARGLFYHPDVSLTDIDQAAWYRCPVHWQPACPPLFRYRQPVRRLPEAGEVFALPQGPRAPSDTARSSD